MAWKCPKFVFELGEIIMSTDLNNAVIGSLLKTLSQVDDLLEERKCCG